MKLLRLMRLIILKPSLERINLAVNTSKKSATIILSLRLNRIGI